MKFSCDQTPVASSARDSCSARTHLFFYFPLAGIYKYTYNFQNPIQTDTCFLGSKEQTSHIEIG